MLKFILAIFSARAASIHPRFALKNDFSVSSDGRNLTFEFYMGYKEDLRNIQVNCGYQYEAYYTDCPLNRENYLEMDENHFDSKIIRGKFNVLDFVDCKFKRKSDFTYELTAVISGRREGFVKQGFYYFSIRYTLKRREFKYILRFFVNLDRSGRFQICNPFLFMIKLK